MKIVCISDTHGRHKKLEIPECDLLIHAGDLTPKGELDMLKSAVKWLVKQPARHIVFVAGNHDFCIQNSPDVIKNDIVSQLPSHVHYLEAGNHLHRDSVIIDGLKIWGSPWTPNFLNWAFNFPEFDLDGKEAVKHWNSIPNDADIVITHGPPFAILDETRRGVLAGCPFLMNRIQSMEPKLHVFGHIHENYGQRLVENTLYVNASVLNTEYMVANPPVIVSL